MFDNHYYKLRLFNGVPILEIDGLRMQLVKNFKTPLDYAKEVVNHLGIDSDNLVLDTCMGLGYTAIEASKKAKKVTTYEISQPVLTIAKWNPWSAPLFNSKKIELRQGDISELIKELPEDSFDAVIHDPPRFTHAPLLYSSEFYAELFRVAKPKARLFHYVGSVGASKGRRIEKEVQVRLENAGFIKFKYSARLQGLLFEKGIA